MRKTIVLAGLIAIAPLLSGCIIADVAGAAVGGAVDLVTTSPEEQQGHDNERLRKENEELRRQQGQNK